MLDFDFLTREMPEFVGKSIKQLTMDDLEKLTSTHIEHYMHYLNLYKLDNLLIYKNININKYRMN